MKHYQIAHFLNLYVRNKTIFQKLKFFDLPRRLPVFPINQGFLEFDLSILNINNLLELGICFPTIYIKIL